jgi:hypothetical protein
MYAFVCPSDCGKRNGENNMSILWRQHTLHIRYQRGEKEQKEIIEMTEPLV